MTIGTKEWAEKNVNFQSGCHANCQYCYARMMACKYNRMTWDEWDKPTIRFKDVEKQYRKRKGRIMFPSSHNIDMSNLNCALSILNKLIISKNKILIVMKPDLEVINILCSSFSDFKKQIEFRFTITTINESKREIFEPRASSINERFQCLEYVLEQEFNCSVSIEPFLDVNPISLIDELLWSNVPPRDIWLGSMNHLTLLSQYSSTIKERLYELKRIYSPNNLFTIKKRLDSRGLKINYKDGFLKQLAKKDD